MMHNWYLLFQLCDSNFPSGAFSHSLGFETFFQKNRLEDREHVEKAISVYIRRQLAFTDGLACKLAYEAAEKEDLQMVEEIDSILFASCLAEESREAGRRMGERMAKVCAELYPSSLLSGYLEGILDKRLCGHPAIVFALTGFGIQAPKEVVTGVCLFSAVSSLVQNAVRGIPIGQTDGQRILTNIQPAIDEALGVISTCTIDDLGISCPGLEIAQMQHERLHVRLFMS